jgi:hypothetical protein
MNGLRTSLLGFLVVLGVVAGPALASSPTIIATPNPVKVGHSVRIHGNAAGCPKGDEVTLISKAFVHTTDFAGLPAIYATVHAHSAYSVTTKLPHSTHPGSYPISARCGGGNFGVTRVLHVVAAGQSQ